MGSDTVLVRLEDHQTIHYNLKAVEQPNERSEIPLLEGTIMMTIQDRVGAHHKAKLHRICTDFILEEISGGEYDFVWEDFYFYGPIKLLVELYPNGDKGVPKSLVERLRDERILRDVLHRLERLQETGTIHEDEFHSSLRDMYKTLATDGKFHDPNRINTTQDDWLYDRPYKGGFSFEELLKLKPGEGFLRIPMQLLDLPPYLVELASRLQDVAPHTLPDLIQGIEQKELEGKRLYGLRLFPQSLIDEALEKKVYFSTTTNITKERTRFSYLRLRKIVKSIPTGGMT